MKIRRLVAALCVPALAVALEHPGGAQEDVPTISVQPVGTSDLDPNQGAWFYTYLNPSESATMRARLTNVASVAQTVRIFLADLRFTETGGPEVAESSTDVGAWGSIEQPVRTLAPHEELIIAFTITAPADAEPGDHVGALVVEGAPQAAEGSGLGIIKRVATRVYATIPGDTNQDITIESVTTRSDSAFYTREETLTVSLRNTGRIRLDPTVSVNGIVATGPATILTRSVESYVATVPVAFWGGPQRYRVDVTTRVRDRAGPTRQLRVSRFIVPWHLIALLVLAGGAGYGARRVWLRRGGRYASLQADIRRIERLLVQRAQPPDAAPERGREDPRAAIAAALKQARRAGDTAAQAKLEDQLRRLASSERERPGAEAQPGDALRAILREIADAGAERREALIRAARSYGTSELDRHPDLLDPLPPEVRLKLFGSRPRRRGR